MKQLNSINTFLSSGAATTDKYLGNEILVGCGDWIVVYDGKYNYYLFSASNGSVMKRKQHKQMPCNKASGQKMTEYYTVYDTAVKNLCHVAANNGFFDFTRRL